MQAPDERVRLHALLVQRPRLRDQLEYELLLTPCELVQRADAQHAAPRLVVAVARLAALSHWVGTRDFRNS
eukprot:4313935-Pleurochrysis_carterae.AAC.4